MLVIVYDWLRNLDCIICFQGKYNEGLLQLFHHQMHLQLTLNDFNFDLEIAKNKWNF